MRPQVHLTAPRGWLNDPHAMTHHQGRYHLFHQWVPTSTEWEVGCSWGHATSEDLLTWEHRGAALAPGDGDDGVWTGCLLDPGDDVGGAAGDEVGDGGDEGGGAGAAARGPRIYYTSVSAGAPHLGRIRSARPSDDGWDTWVKGGVELEAPAGMDLVVFRDPMVVRRAGRWRMVVGAGLRSGTAAAVSFSSTDLQRWTCDGLLASRSSQEREPVWTGSTWECPQLVEVDGRWALLVGVWNDGVLHDVAGAVGAADDPGDGSDLGDGTCSSGRGDHAGPHALRDLRWQQVARGDLYAPCTFHDREGRACLLLWVRGVQDAQQGWSGCLSAPHVLSVVEDRLLVAPHPALVAARVGEVDVEGLMPSGPVDVVWALEPSLRPSRGRAGLRLVDAGGAAVAELQVGADGGALSVTAAGRSWDLPIGDVVRLLVDGPVLECWSGGAVLGVALGGAQALARLQVDGGSCRAWQLRPGARGPGEAAGRLRDGRPSR